MGSIWAIIPVKQAEASKSRLGAVLDPEERQFLALRWLEAAIQACQQTSHIGQVVVVSADVAALAVARRLGAVTIRERVSDGLNRAVERGIERALPQAQAVVVLTADLPLVSWQDVEALVELGFSLGSPSVVVGPDHSGRGTSALWLNPPAVIPPAFEGASCPRHLAMAAAAGVQVASLVRAGWHDVDTPDDLILLQESDRSA